MTDEVRGRTMYERALDLVEEGVAVAIVPICSADHEEIGLYALTVDLAVRPDLRGYATSTSREDRAATALGMTIVAAEALRDKDFKHRRVP